MSNNQLLDALTREGVLINVSVRYWRAAKKLSPEDLGLNDQQVNNRLISLGHKRLLPREALARFALIESRAHALIDQSTFSFLGGIARFLPNRKLAEVRSTLDALAEEYELARTEFVQSYEDLRQQSLEEWREAAYGLQLNPDDLVDRLASAYPPADRLARYFAFDVHLYQVQAPESLQRQLIESSEQAAIAQAREQAVQDARQKITQDAEVFIADCVATLRQETANICHEMLSSMQTGKTEGVHQKTLNRLLKFIDDFKTLNFAGDDELERMLEHTRKTLLSRTAEEYRDNLSARNQLQAGLKQLGDEARNLAKREAREIVERFGQVGVRRIQRAA